MATRRGFIKNACALTAGAAVSGQLAKTSNAQNTASNERATRGIAQLRFDKSIPVVQTSGGQLRGYIRNGVHTFKGIPYGASTAGKNRFMPPVKPEPWKGIFNAVAYGYACLQVHGNDWQDPFRISR